MLNLCPIYICGLSQQLQVVKQSVPGTNVIAGAYAFNLPGQAQGI